MVRRDTIRNCKQITNLSFEYANRHVQHSSLLARTHTLALRLYHCFGFNVFKYCVYTDGFLDQLLAILNAIA
ncbi:MAG: hypothetical protein AAI978_00340 [Candidatus Hodgkinia cicadicola]